jgi:acyl-CoA synthetase (NDP forming)
VNNLEFLFNPKTVAVIGASSNPTKWGNWLAEQVAKHKTERKVYFVNPKKETIFGINCMQSIDQIPELIEVAVVAVPPSSYEDTIDDLLKHKVSIIIGITSKIDTDTQRRVAEKCKEFKTHLIGPNCAGVWSNDFHCLPIGEFTTGPVAMISQSGGILVDVHERLKETNLGFSKALSIGNQTGVSFEDVLPMLEEDSDTKVIALYAESTDSIPYNYIRLMTKPVLILSARPTIAAKLAAKEHTNSELNEIGEYYSISQFVAELQIKLYGKKAKGKTVSVITDTGGFGVMINSLLEFNGMVVHSYYDLIGIPSAFSSTTTSLLKSVIQNKTDIIIMNLNLYDRLYDEVSEAEEIVKLVNSTDKPVIFCCRDLYNSGVRVLLRENIPVYKDIEDAVYAVRKICG